MKTTNNLNLPEIVSREEWNKEREELLKEEKELTRQRDKLSAKRRRLPMVEIEKDYVFEGPGGEASLLDLFEDRRQLIVDHFMFHPEWDEGCKSCSFLADNIGHLSHLHARNISLVMISRAPLQKLQAYKKRMGWDIPWYSSYESDFNYDFNVTRDDNEHPATSVFLRAGDRTFQTYFTTGRGEEPLVGLAGYMDITPYGRQEEWEDSPEGWPQTPPFEWVRRHDEYQTN